MLLFRICPLCGYNYKTLYEMKNNLHDDCPKTQKQIEIVEQTVEEWSLEKRKAARIIKNIIDSQESVNPEFDKIFKEDFDKLLA